MNQHSYYPMHVSANTEKKFVRSKTSFAFASIFLTIATITCIGSAVMLWQAWQEIQSRNIGQHQTTPAVEIESETKTERLSAAAQLAATIRNSSNGSATSRRTTSTKDADARATAWFDSTAR